MTMMFEPGATLGILGGGQLGRMLALVARRLGYAVHVFTPEPHSPAGQVADMCHVANYDDVDAVARFARQVSVVTFEFENVPVETIETVERYAPVRPGAKVLHVTQHRLREKQFLRDAGMPTARFAPLTASQDFSSALAHVGFPAVLKTTTLGYDGRGQRKVGSLEEAIEAWRTFDHQPLIAEEFVQFTRELSVVAVRGADGQFAHYGPIHNQHRHHILDVSLCPARIPASVTQDAIEMTRVIVEQLDVVGVLCVEFFMTREGRLVVNELAPRPHNSGHLTIEAHRTSQFEQQLRAVCGLPLGSTKQLCPAAMVNLLGDVWDGGEPAWQRVLSDGSAFLHLYGKDAPRPGRKMGHVTVVAKSAREAARRATKLRAALKKDSATRSSSAPVVGAN